MRRFNLLTSIIAFCISMALIWGASKMDYAVEYSPAAGFFPFWLGIFFALLSLALFLKNIFGSRDKKTENFFPSEEGRNRVLLYIVVLTLCIFLIGKLGFVITCFLFTVFTLICLGKYSLKKGLITSSLMIVVIYALFDLALRVPLPKGFLGF